MVATGRSSTWWLRNHALPSTQAFFALVILWFSTVSSMSSQTQPQKVQVALLTTFSSVPLLLMRQLSAEKDPLMDNHTPGFRSLLAPSPRAISGKPAYRWTSERGEQFLDLALDQVAHLAKLVVGQFLGVRDVPLLAPPRSHQGTGVTAAHRHGDVDLLAVERLQRLRGVYRQVVADLAHEGHGARVDSTRGT